jgi:8-hydroxy-5-deazaflavin:NADPH oxidoreductase
MTIAIIGTGRMAEGLGKRLVKAGETVTLAGRDAKKTGATAKRIGALAGPVSQAAKAEVVILAIPYRASADALKAAGDLSGKIVVDITNPVGPELSLAVGLTTSWAEEIQKMVPEASVVIAFNAIFAELLGLEFGPDDIPPQVLYAGDDQAAKDRVAGLITAIGFEPLDAGPLRNARLIEPIALMTINFGYALGHGTRISPRFIKY